jgi:hypothetical protein
VSLDQSHPAAKACRSCRSHQACGPPTDDDGIVYPTPSFFCHGIRPCLSYPKYPASTAIRSPAQINLFAIRVPDSDMVVHWQERMFIGDLFTVSCVCNSLLRTIMSGEENQKMARVIREEWLSRLRDKG